MSLKYNTLFIFLIFCINVNFAQTELQSVENFKIVNLKVVTPYTTIQKSGITLSFDIEMPSENEYFKNSYYLSVNLYNISGKEIYNDNENFIKFYAQPFYKDKSKCYLTGNEIFIPFNDLEASEGLQNIILKFNLKSDYNYFGNVYEDTLVIEKPEIFDYEDQNFEVYNFIVENKSFEGELEGINVNFYCDFDFYSNQIKNFSNIYDDADYYFFIKLFDLNTSEEYYLFDNDFNFYKQTVDNLTEKIKFFIPYNKININQGVYSIKTELFVTNKFSTIDFGKIGETTFQLTQPELYLAKFNLNYLKSNLINYDSQNVLGQIFSNPYKNKGKGFPDIFWSIYLGEFDVYNSAIRKNSFSVKSDSTMFIVSAKDPVYLKVFDYDALNNNDLISEFTIDNILSDKVKIYDNVEIQNIDSSYFSFSVNKLPYFENNKVNISEFSENGITGIKVNFNCKINAIPDNEKIEIVPFVKRDSIQFDLMSVYNYFANDVYYFTNENPENNFNFFFPYILLKDSDILGFKFEFQNYSFNLTDIIVDYKIQIPELEDVKIKIENIEEKFFNEIYGIEIKSVFTFPKFYFNEINLENIYIDANFVNSHKNDTLSVYTESFLINDSIVYKNFFIPYYQFEKTEIKQNVNYYTKVKYGDLILGNNSETFYISTNEIIDIELLKLSFKIVNADFEKFYFAIDFGNEQFFKSAEFSNYETDIEINNKLKCHLKDKITINFYAVDKFGLEKQICQNTLDLSEFEKTNKIKIKPEKIFKKTFLYASPIIN